MNKKEIGALVKVRLTEINGCNIQQTHRETRLNKQTIYYILRGSGNYTIDSALTLLEYCGLKLSVKVSKA